MISVVDSNYIYQRIFEDSCEYEEARAYRRRIISEIRKERNGNNKGMMEAWLELIDDLLANDKNSSCLESEGQQPFQTENEGKV